MVGFTLVFPLFCGPRRWSRPAFLAVSHCRSWRLLQQRKCKFSCQEMAQRHCHCEAGWGRARGAELLPLTGCWFCFPFADMGKGLVLLRRAEQCFVAAMAAQPGRLHHLGARLPVPGVMEQYMLCLTMHPRYSWVLPACVCGADCWWRGQKSGFGATMLPGGFLAQCRERAGVAFGDKRPCFV